jgi:hypothetical protein
MPIAVRTARGLVFCKKTGKYRREHGHALRRVGLVFARKQENTGETFEIPGVLSAFVRDEPDIHCQFSDLMAAQFFA